MFDSFRVFNRINEIRTIVKDAHALVDGRFKYAPLGFESLAEDLLKIREEKQKVQQQHHREWMFSIDWEGQRLSLERFQRRWHVLEAIEDNLIDKICEKVDLLKDEEMILGRELCIHNYRLWCQL